LPENNEEFLWEAYLLLGYHYIEYALSEKAQQIIAKSVLISETFIKDSPENAQWLYKNSHSYQLLSLYELDFGSLENAISSNIKAIERGLKAISFDDSDLKKHNNIRILYNQIGFLYLEQGENLKAIDALYKALQFGLELKIKAPFNQKFQRELSYSYSTIGEAYKINKQPQKALINFEKGLKISREIYQKNKNDFSSANDLSIDLIHVASIQKSVGNIDQHFSLLSEAHEIMSLVHQHEPENKYYTHTFASLLLMLDKPEKAIALINQLIQASMVDNYLMSLIKKHKLNYLLENPN
jgi:tetratricopeptide (TPR) repeat protein